MHSKFPTKPVVPQSYSHTIAAQCCFIVSYSDSILRRGRASMNEFIIASCSPGMHEWCRLTAETKWIMATLQIPDKTRHKQTVVTYERRRIPLYDDLYRQSFCLWSLS